MSQTIDLSQYPAPEILESLSFDAVFEQVKAFFIARFPNDEALAAEKGVPTQAQVTLLMEVEGNLIVKALQAYAYHALQIRGRVNDAAKATMLAYATGTDLDNLAAFYSVSRLEGESDTDLRGRLVLAVDGFSTAGPVGAYKFHALSADDDVKDVSIQAHTPTAGSVTVNVLSRSGDGVADPATLAAVLAALNDEDVRPLNDTVLVNSATVNTFTVDAQIYLYGNLDQSVVLAAAESAVQAYVDSVHRLGHDVTLSGLYSALHQPGVQRAEIASPAATIINDETEASFCVGINLTYGGTDV